MKTPITTTEEPSFDRWRDTRIEYTESLGEAYKSLSIETYFTLNELTAIVHELRGEGES